jgi:hypothetical protein
MVRGRTWTSTPQRQGTFEVRRHAVEQIWLWRLALLWPADTMLDAVQEYLTAHERLTSLAWKRGD